MIAKNHSFSARVGHGYVYFVILGGIFGMPEFFSIKMILWCCVFSINHLETDHQDENTQIWSEDIKYGAQDPDLLFLCITLWLIIMPDIFLSNNARLVQQCLD